jgi:hypothetical protein
MTTKPEEKLSPIEHLYAIIFLALFFGIPASFVWSITPDFIRYPLFYSIRYQVPHRRVVVDKKPDDCEWWHSPLGDKGCHYEKFVLVQPKYGRPITEVNIMWVKMQD